MGYAKNGNCEKGPRIKSLEKRLPYPCKRNSTYIEKCEYTESDGNSFYLDCECGVNRHGNAYCPLAKGFDINYFKEIRSI